MRELVRQAVAISVRLVVLSLVAGLILGALQGCAVTQVCVLVATPEGASCWDAKLPDRAPR